MTRGQRTTTPAEPLPDIEAQRRELVETITAIIRADAWRDCPRPRCKRARACRMLDADCAGRPDGPPMTDEEWARFQVVLKRGLKIRMEQIEAEKAAAANAKEAMPWR